VEGLFDIAVAVWASRARFAMQMHGNGRCRDVAARERRGGPRCAGVHMGRCTRGCLGSVVLEGKT
jgi:hypothetical protein